jgi:hypothetical protein
MRNLARQFLRKPQVKRHKPVIIDCIGPLTPGFVETFDRAIDEIDLALPVLVQFKRATFNDMHGLTAIAETIGRRRISGGYAAFIAASSRWRDILQRGGISADWILREEDASANRRIILANAAHGAPA